MERRSSIDYAKLLRNDSLDNQWKTFLLSLTTYFFYHSLVLAALFAPAEDSCITHTPITSDTLPLQHRKAHCSILVVLKYLQHHTVNCLCLQAKKVADRLPCVFIIISPLYSEVQSNKSLRTTFSYDLLDFVFDHCT